MNIIFGYILPVLIGLIGIRTMCWHLQNWQLREYKWSRLKAHMSTVRGKRSIYNLWFFPGILPRPKITVRVIMICIVVLVLSFGLFWSGVEASLSFWLLALIWERLLWLLVLLGVFLSAIPVNVRQKQLFAQAQKVREASKNITVIGITGSYGKSSTKEILVHLLKQEFGDDAVLYNPRNENTEVSIARLILRKKSFFESQKKKYFVAEVGAYKKGEIEKVCRFVQPDLSIITGVNAQHLPLFGSQRNIQEAKFEMAEAAKEKVFYNIESDLLREIVKEKEIPAVKVPVSATSAKDVSPSLTQTEFEYDGQKFVLPWAGEFFITNALLAINVCKELGINIVNLANSLQTLPQLENALRVEKKPNGATVLVDLYSANESGVLAAIDHMSRFAGEKIFIGIPLKELGDTSLSAHKKIFQSLRDCKAFVFWFDEDYSELGKEICAERFYGANKEQLLGLIKNLSANDVVLLESKLSQEIITMVL